MKPSKSEGLREKKKRLTRQHISDMATKLFFEHGFENVTVADVALAADVSRMTVSNYFSRKEELFFDRLDELCELLEKTLRQREARSPVAALRELTEELFDQKHQMTMRHEGVVKFWQVVAESPSLLNYALLQFDEISKKLGRMMAKSAGEEATDPTAHLLATIIGNTWRIAYTDALQREQSNPGELNTNAMKDIIIRGFNAAEAAARDTRYI